MPVPIALEPGASLWSDAWKRLRKNRMAVISGLVLLVVALLVVSAPILPGVPDPNRQDLELGAVPPSPGHPMGTDILGRDLLARVLYGGQISLLVGLVATLVSFLIGVTWGAVAGYFGGRLDNLMMRFVDVLYSLPYMFLVILLLVFFSRSIVMLFVALGAVQWLTMARIVRGQVLSLKHREFVEAARAIGTSHAGIIFRHLIPNALGPIIVYATLTVPAVMLQEAFLSFLGLGVQPPDASWGVLVNEGASVMGLFPWLVIFPGFALALTLFCLNFLGDGLRDALDPHLRKE
ncbi:MAG TPA: ABC transporter permease [Candidatus Eisenbacteria bacterium]